MMTKNGFQDRVLLNAGRMYFRMLQGEHSAILSTFIKLPFALKTFVLSILSGRSRQVLLYLVLNTRKGFFRKRQIPRNRYSLRLNYTTHVFKKSVIFTFVAQFS